jgi:hypothetical protein
MPARRSGTAPPASAAAGKPAGRRKFGPRWMGSLLSSSGSPERSARFLP